MWSAFVTGFAKESTKMIDERNKEISERALAEMESLLKKKVEADETALTKRNEYREQAKALRELSGKRLTENQVKGILQSGQAKTVIDNLKKRTVGTDKLAKLFVPASADDQRTVEDYIKEATALTGTAPPQIEERTAFGLKTRAGESVRQRAAAAAGVPLEELYKTEMAEGTTEPTGVLDLSVFEEEASVSDMENSLIKTMIDPQASKEEKREAAKTLGQIGAAKDLLKADKEGGPGGVKESDVRSNFRILDATIKKQFAGPGDLVRYTDPATGEVSLELSNDVKPEVRQQINEARSAAFNAYIQEHYSQTGSVPPAVRRVASAFLGTAPEPVKPAGAPAPKPPEGKVVVTTPDNRRIIFNTQREADAFKAAAGIK